MTVGCSAWERPEDCIVTTCGVQWQVDGLEQMLYTLVPSDEYVVVAAIPTEKKITTYWAGYRITDESNLG